MREGPGLDSFYDAINNQPSIVDFIQHPLPVIAVERVKLGDLSVHVDDVHTCI